MTISANRCVFRLVCLAITLLVSIPATAAPRKPKRQEPAPDITIQVLERRLADQTLSAQERSRLSVTLARNYYTLKQFDREAEVLEDALAAGIADTSLVAEAHYYLGRTYEALGESERAADEFVTVWQQYPDCKYHPNAAMELGDLMLLASNVVEATQWYETVSDLQPKGKLGFLARDKLRAMAAGKSAEEITDESHRPVFVKEQFRRLDQYLYSQLYDKADALAQELTASATNAQLRAAMNYHLAHHYWMYGHIEGADRFVTEAVQTTGERHVEALILAGHIKRGLWQTDSALAYYQEAIKAAPAKEMTITAYQQSTRLLLKSGREAEGLALAAEGEKAFADKAELPAYLDRIANTLRDRAHPQWTNYAARVAVTATNEFGRRALMQLANDARRRQDWSAAQQLYGQLIARPTKSWRSTMDMRGRLLDAQLQQTNLIAAAATEAAILASATGVSEGAEAYAAYRLGKIWSANGKSDAAEQRWRQVLTDYPHTQLAGMAQVQLGHLYEGRGDLTNAVAMYEAFLTRNEAPVRFQLHSYVRLVGLKEALGDAIGGGALLDQARALALQSNDAELQLKLARYLLRNGDKAHAFQLLDTGIENAEGVIRVQKDPQKRLWWEYLIARRLDDFHEDARLADRAAKIEPGLLENPVLDTPMRYALYSYLINALEKSGRWAEAETLCQKAIASVPEDSQRVGHILLRLSEQARHRGDHVRARELALAAFREVPTSFISQMMYLRLATEDFASGRYTDALGKIEELERALPVTVADPTFPGVFRSDCQYLKGRCLKAMGQTAAGQQLIVGALTQKPHLGQLCDPRPPSPASK